MHIDEVLAQIFACPDDGGNSLVAREDLRCELCARTFPRLGPRLFELKALLPKAINSVIQKDYEDAHSAAFTLDGQPPGWGGLATSNPGRRVFVKREREAISNLLGERAGGVVIDVSGGVGNYSGFLADKARTMIHCELHMPSIAQAFQEQSHPSNLFFARSDYLALPLRDAIVDGAICTDTLIRGDRHDRALLSEIRRVLKPGGRAVVDFHNHRFKRIQKRSPLANSYELANFLAMVKEVGFNVENVQGIGYVPTRAVPREAGYDLINALFRRLVSPSRYLVVLSRKDARQ